MLACQPLHQHFDYTLDQSVSSHAKQQHHQHQQQLALFNHLAAAAAATSSSSNYDAKLPVRYQDSLPASSFDSSSPSSQQQALDVQFMSSAFDVQNPAIRIQQSTPTPGLQLHAGHPQNQQQLQFDNGSSTTYGAQYWNQSFGSNGQMVATQNLQTPGLTRSRPHQRNQSSSSVASSGSASPYSQGHATYTYATADASAPAHTASKLGVNYNAESSRAFSNHNLPTPTQTPTQDTFLASSYPTYSQAPIDSTQAAHLAMNHALEHTSNLDEDLPGMSHSARQSISSLGQEPSTPRTVAGDLYDDAFKQPGETSLWQEVPALLEEYLHFDDAEVPRHDVPKLSRTVSDAIADELYIPQPTPIYTQIPSRPSASQQYLSPRNAVTERLQAANLARSQSPTSATSGGVSPFRSSSPYAHVSYDASRYQTAAQVRQRQKQQADANEISHSQHRSQQEVSTPKTISPKDALLDYHESEEESKMPLFPQTSGPGYDAQFVHSQQQQNYQAQSQYDNSAAFGNLDASNRADNWANPRRQSASAFSATSPIPSQQQSSYNFNSTPISANLGNLPFSSQNYRSAASSTAQAKQEETPDFPAHLTSMESSASEAPPSSNNSAHTETQKPGSSLADTGTYTCTYHGCTLRFETPQKLQKHKREGHRNPATTSPASPGIAAATSSMTSAAILQRNSQAGPHKCERINPTSGKPCNTIFSRPYDLTRHEDTIHNIRKQKVRCALCVEEKTFSRNDALTRHMRVVHPEVDFPGKHRRRGHD
jgi:hypothetical protein